MSHDSHKKYAHAFDEVLRSVGDRRAPLDLPSRQAVAPDKPEPVTIQVFVGGPVNTGKSVLESKPLTQSMADMLKKAMEKRDIFTRPNRHGGGINPCSEQYGGKVTQWKPEPIFDAAKDFYTLPNGKVVSAIEWAEMNHVLTKPARTVEEHHFAKIAWPEAQEFRLSLLRRQLPFDVEEYADGSTTIIVYKVNPEVYR